MGKSTGNDIIEICVVAQVNVNYVSGHIGWNGKAVIGLQKDVPPAEMKT